MNNNIFIKNNKTDNKLLSDEILSDELSDELNNLIGIKKQTQTQTQTQIQTQIQTKSIENKDSEFDIGQIYSNISSCLQNYKFCKITGEIITFKISDSNAWINIKCKDFQITGVFWNITRDKNYQSIKSVKSGDQIIFRGNFSIMKKNLNVYFNIKSMEFDGKGNYLDIYEQYRLKIKEMNLGIPKKSLNLFPYSIGIITASGGAAIQDIIQTLKLDGFIGNIIIKNALVQGSQCPSSLIDSIEWFEKKYPSQIDLLMITRGGGSYDDLVGFSNWELLVKVSACPFVTLSAVGHQIDNQLTDEVADLKFATPSIGAKFIVETQQKYRDNLNDIQCVLTNIFDQYNKSKYKFNLVTENYSNILKKYDVKNMLIRVRKYSSSLNNIVSRYSNLKNLFYTRLSNLKPTIMRNEDLELTSLADFVNLKKNKEIKPKKIEIFFIDGKIKISYKIIEYEQY